MRREAVVDEVGEIVSSRRRRRSAVKKDEGSSFFQTSTVLDGPMMLARSTAATRALEATKSDARCTGRALGGVVLDSSPDSQHLPRR